MVREEGGEPGGTLELLRGWGYEWYAVDGTGLTEAMALAPAVIRIVASKTGCRPTDRREEV
jgi:hypothetical protein